MLGAGVRIVVAQSFARIFFRNAINVGVLSPRLQGSDKIKDKAKVKVNVKGGYLEADGKRSRPSRCRSSCRASSMPAGLLHMQEVKGGSGMYKIASIGGAGSARRSWPRERRY